MMTPSLEHDYIGLSEVSDKLAIEVENLRETELRLGLPGSLSPERKEKVGLSLGLQLPKGFAAGAKRGFSDALDRNGKWVFSVSGGSEGEMEKGGVLFSPRAAGGGCGGQIAGAGKEVPGKALGGLEKKAQGMPAAK